MSRTRHPTEPPETAATYPESGSGCFPGFFLPPFAILVFGFILAFFGFHLPAQPLAAPEGSVPSTPLASLFTSEVQYWGDSILRWAAASNIDPNLAAVIMQIESCGNPSATSSAGAMGLFQVMPYHFYITDDPYDPDTNAARAMSYLKRTLNAGGGDIGLALAGYNGGIGVMGFGSWAWPDETNRYVYWGTGIYEDAKNGATQSGRLNEWLQAGGSSLCAQARVRLNLP